MTNEFKNVQGNLGENVDAYVPHHAITKLQTNQLSKLGIRRIPLMWKLTIKRREICEILIQ